MLSTTSFRTVVLFLICCLISSPALASCWPGAPGTDPRLCPPNDPEYKKNQWNLSSSIPDEVRPHMNPKEAAIGSTGISVDRAWQLTLGRDEVVIAVLDSGIRWNHVDLTNKLYLNRNELPLPRKSNSYDANHDGIFNIQDYAAEGISTPQDLIQKYSNGRDNDGNGYVDDICGFDFFVGDNDPKDDIDFGHGTSQASTSASEANNGVGGVSVCPKCRVLPVRVGDSFAVDANRFARGVVFAVRSGATVIAEALGSLNNTPTARMAVDFAYERGIPIIASAADEYAYHHNYPGVYNHTAYVNSIRFDHASDPIKATTFWGLNGCSNFGARVWVTVPAVSCSSGATSRLAGVTGLLQSTARERSGKFLRAEQIYQLIRATATDLVVPEWDDGKDRFPAKQGFDQIHGYGRANAFAAVEAVRNGQIPPEVDLWNPDWFEIVAPSRTPSRTIQGRVQASGAPIASWRLQYALGVEPTESAYLTVEKSTAGGNRTGAFGKLRFSDLPLPSGPPPKNRNDRDRYSVTLRLQAWDESGLQGEARRSFFVFEDPSWKPGFPFDLHASGEAGPTVVDLDGDRRDEIVLPTADGLLRVLHVSALGIESIARGALDLTSPTDPLGAIPAPRETVERAATVGDIDGSGRLRIVVASREGKIYVFEPDAERVLGFPVSVRQTLEGPATPDRQIEIGIFSRPILADLDRLPGKEIVVTALDGHLYAWHGDATMVPGFPVPAVGAKIVSTPAVGDIDGDGEPEIIFGTNEIRDGSPSVYAVRARGMNDPRGPFVRGWDPLGFPALRPLLLPTIGTGVTMDPALIDIDGDGDMEVALGAITHRLYLVDHQKSGSEEGPHFVAEYSTNPGKASEFRPPNYFLTEMGSPLVADLDHNGAPEIFAPLLSGRVITQRLFPAVPMDVPLAMGGWDARSGKALPAFPQRTEDLQIFVKPTAADIDGDGRDEILAGSGGYLVHAFKMDGGEPDGFPKFTGGWVFSSVATGDLEGDGLRDVVAVTREGYLFAWTIPGINGSKDSPGPNSIRRKP